MDARKRLEEIENELSELRRQERANIDRQWELLRERKTLEKAVRRERCGLAGADAEIAALIARP